MDATAPSAPSLDATLHELAALGLRGSRVVVRLMEIEGAIAEAATAWLPDAGRPDSLTEAATAGQGIDMATEAMQGAVPRTDMLARALERLSRSVRRTVALIRRLESGWPRSAPDHRAAMVRRQVARGVAEAICREHDGEAAERLFDDLLERLDDPALEAEISTLPVPQVIRRICRDLGLATATLGTVAATLPAKRAPDTG